LDAITREEFYRKKQCLPILKAFYSRKTKELRIVFKPDPQLSEKTLRDLTDKYLFSTNISEIGLYWLKSEINGNILSVKIIHENIADFDSAEITIPNETKKEVFCQEVTIIE